MKPIYPAWIPLCAVEWDLEAFGSRNELDASSLPVLNKYNVEFARCLNKVISDFRAERVWHAITKRVPEKELRRFLGRFVHEMAGGAINGPSEFWDLTPRKEREKHFEEIISTAEKLIYQLKKLGQESRHINCYKLYYDHPWFDGLVREEDLNLKKHRELYSREDWREDQLKEVPQGLNTEEHLEDLILYIRNVQDYQSHLVSVSSDRDSARLMYFIRSLHRFFYEELQTPLDDAIATLANVLFHREDIDRDKVKSYRRNRNYPTSDDSAKMYGFYEVHEE